VLIAVLVGLGAAVGAPSRYLVDRVVQARTSAGGVRYPLGTLLINLSGSLVLGLLIGLASGHGVSAEVLAAVGTGWCGAYTTYSTFAYETIQLTHDGYGVRAAGYVLVSIMGGLALAALGYTLGSAIMG
jgi:fluoride exporter